MKSICRSIKFRQSPAKCMGRATAIRRQTARFPPESRDLSKSHLPVVPEAFWRKMICRVSVSDKRSTIHFHKIEIDSHSSGSTARPARIGFCRRYSHFSDSNSFDLSKRSKQPSCQRQCVGSPSDTDGLQFEVRYASLNQRLNHFAKSLTDASRSVGAARICR